VTLSEVLARARERIDRLTPGEAWAAVRDGAVIVDTRAAPERAIPGSLLVPRTVLEWRLAPDSDSRSPHAPPFDAHVIVLCDHGESSSLAAASLREIGFARAADVVGGFGAWQADGLPLVEVPPPIHRWPGMDPPVPSKP
jgi:rhodanese-related sulfurtransferase